MNDGAARLRWIPTVEQLQILEEAYKQGVRTPRPDMIEQLAGRLREYGHIEGKNVFYWFQNHKARDRRRQKQEQESVGYLVPYTSHPFHSFQGSYFLVPPYGVTMQPHHPPVVPLRTAVDGVRYDNLTAQKEMIVQDDELYKTLELFPLHPSGYGEARENNSKSSF